MRMRAEYDSHARVRGLDREFGIVDRLLFDVRYPCEEDCNPVRQQDGRES